MAPRPGALGRGDGLHSGLRLDSAAAIQTEPSVSL